MSMDPYWSEANGGPHAVKYESEAAVSSFPYCTESSLNFSTSGAAYSEDDAEYATSRRNKASRQDPLSHRIIEKRRRDRMNSCLADLSRLIPPQYQRKGRGRIEKTEIIEMAIRHLKHLQSECMQKENEYRMGYTECIKETVKFLYDSQMQDFCYRLVPRLQEHCEELMKTDYFKGRSCHANDNVSASSGSPHHHPYNLNAPQLCQLREMLDSPDIDHSSDHNDVKDLSFRNHISQLHRASVNGAVVEGSSSNNNSSNSNIINNSTCMSANNNSSSLPPLSNGKSSMNINVGAPQTPHAAVITSTASAAALLQHTDSSNHDFDSSREPILHTDNSNVHSPPPRGTPTQHLDHHALHHEQQSSRDNLLLQQSSRMRNFSESSHDIEHNNNYKYKNHIKERFNHELHDEETNSEHCSNSVIAPPLLPSEHSHTHSMSEHSKDGTEPDVAPIMAKKRKMAEANSISSRNNSNNNGLPEHDHDTQLLPPARASVPHSILCRAGGVSSEEKPFCFNEIKTEINSPACGILHHKAHLNTANSSNTEGVPPTHATPTPLSSDSVPIFAMHCQGTYYVPLNVDYTALLPYLNGVDLLQKNYTSMPAVHPININVNFMPHAPSASLLAAAAAAAAVAAGKQQAPPAVNGVMIPAIGGTGTGTAAIIAKKTKAELSTNGW